jgi:Flp pilus assembly protein TadD
MMNGTLVQDALPDIIRHIYSERLTGELKITHYSAVKSVFFELGAIVFASSNDPQDRIGESMMRNRLLSPEDFSRASAQMSRGKRFGRVLIEMGVISERDLRNSVIFQVLDIIYSLFLWTTGKYEFTPTAKAVADDLRLELSTASIILEGVRRIKDPGVIQKGIGDLNRLIAPSNNPLLRTQTLSLKPLERQLASAVSAPMNVLQALALVSTPPPATLQALYGLISAGILERCQPPVVNAETGQLDVPQQLIEQAADAPPTIPPRVAAMAAKQSGSLKNATMIADMQARIAGTSDPYELLGVTRHATREEIRDAYYRLAKDFHPDRHLGASLEVRRAIEALFARITESYETIREHDTLRRRTGTMAPLTPPPGFSVSGLQTQETAALREQRAEQMYQDARAKISSRDFNAAVALLREAVRLAPEAARYQLLLGTTLAAHPKTQREAEATLKKAAELDPFNPNPLNNLGQLYARAGMSIQAEKAFQQALTLDPSSKAALKGLETLRLSKPSGFLDRLFKR